MWNACLRFFMIWLSFFLFTGRLLWKQLYIAHLRNSSLLFGVYMSNVLWLRFKVFKWQCHHPSLLSSLFLFIRSDNWKGHIFLRGCKSLIILYWLQGIFLYITLHSSVNCRGQFFLRNCGFIRAFENMSECVWIQAWCVTEFISSTATLSLEMCDLTFRFRLFWLTRLNESRH
jgi:hypothetical protein